jgi:hypothetical protein
LEISNKFNLLTPFINVAESEIDIPGIDAGGSAKVTFLVNVDGNAADGILNYSLQAESGHHTDLLESQIPLGYTIEDFEGETLNEDLQWNLGSGNKKWAVAEDTTAQGGHCMRSPSINNNAVALNKKVLGLFHPHESSEAHTELIQASECVRLAAYALYSYTLQENPEQQLILYRQSRDQIAQMKIYLKRFWSVIDVLQSNNQQQTEQ